MRVCHLYNGGEVSSEVPCTKPHAWQNLYFKLWKNSPLIRQIEIDQCYAPYLTVEVHRDRDPYILNT